MKKLLLILSFAVNLALISCSGGGPREESYDQDSIDAVKSADSMLQQQLNSDTSMNTDSTTDNEPTDSMQDNSQRR
jgi:hypothetical protein